LSLSFLKQKRIKILFTILISILITILLLTVLFAIAREIWGDEKPQIDLVQKLLIILWKRSTLTAIQNTCLYFGVITINLICFVITVNLLKQIRWTLFLDVYLTQL